ncbi:Aste57867_3433 [Aphanomyces stellatus]|uniref:Aste57867_3433 protein n=1 Tax=Aphanomyces stellatus TaxID=120398 RepID=A0A485KFF8_9STRA|nr:hypothetical protein As57867_003423 [Aphanomyces stellatus]VFT80599.1 Aste57867_3433 [Aphanomyces stellatus]
MAQLWPPMQALALHQCLTPEVVHCIVSFTSSSKTFFDFLVALRRDLACLLDLCMLPNPLKPSSVRERQELHWTDLTLAWLDAEAAVLVARVANLLVAHLTHPVAIEVDECPIYSSEGYAFNVDAWFAHLMQLHVTGIRLIHCLAWLRQTPADGANFIRTLPQLSALRWLDVHGPIDPDQCEDASVDPGQWDRVFEFIETSHLTRLSWAAGDTWYIKNCCYINQTQARMLAHWLTCEPSIKCLHLEKCAFIDDAASEIVTPALFTASSLHRLELSTMILPRPWTTYVESHPIQIAEFDFVNVFGTPANAPFLRGLAYSKTLSVAIKSVCTPPQLFDTLCPVLPLATHLVHMSIDSISLGDVLMTTLAPAIASMPTLTRLQLATVAIADTSAILLAEVFATSTSRLKELDVSDNFIGLQGACALIDCFGRRSLTRLTLHGLLVGLDDIPLVQETGASCHPELTIVASSAAMVLPCLRNRLFNAEKYIPATVVDTTRAWIDAKSTS